MVADVGRSTVPARAVVVPSEALDPEPVVVVLEPAAAVAAAVRASPELFRICRVRLRHLLLEVAVAAGA